MMTNKPTISRNFEESIRTNANSGIYRVNVNGILIDVFPYIFPPQSPFSESTHTVYDQFGHLDSKKVLDIGTGTGIQAIQAYLAGARKVDAVDINDDAIICAKHNIRLNGLEGKISTWQSDLFSNIPNNHYDLIIANLPIVEVDELDIRLHSLYDPGFFYHERLFETAPRYLSESGKITLCHANLQEKSFERLEDVAKTHGFSFDVKQKVNSLDYEWRNYDFRYEGGKRK